MSSNAEDGKVHHDTAGHPSLAQELQDKILSELCPVDDLKTLLECALVSHGWHRFARTRLLSWVRLNVGTKEGLTMKRFFTFVIHCADVEFSEGKKAHVPFAHTFVKDVTILGVPFSIHHAPCIPDVLFDNLRNLIANLPSLESLVLDRVCLKTDVRLDQAHTLDWTPVCALKSLKMDLDTLEANCVIAWVLSLCSSIDHLDLRCRISRRKIGFPMAYFMGDCTSPIPPGPTENIPFAIRHLSVDSDYHLPDLVRYFRYTRQLQGVKALSVRCYNKKDVLALNDLLRDSSLLGVEDLALGSINTQLSFTDASLVQLSELKELTLFGPALTFNRVIGGPQPDRLEPSECWHQLWDIIEHPLPSLRELTIQFRIHGDDTGSRVVEVLGHSMPWTRLESHVLAQPDLTDVRIVCIVKSSTKPATLEEAERILKDCMPRVGAKVRSFSSSIEICDDPVVYTT